MPSMMIFSMIMIIYPSDASVKGIRAADTDIQGREASFASGGSNLSPSQNLRFSYPYARIARDPLLET